MISLILRYFLSQTTDASSSSSSSRDDPPKADFWLTHYTNTGIPNPPKPVQINDKGQNSYKIWAMKPDERPEDVVIGITHPIAESDFVNVVKSPDP
ncbi:uncharacterized protein DSM5745_05108 [Aspergillus mulundensis]|uniref:Uncharacterized protein n=1 Tax=Aspergillus mulundensis TaxID=1810919 RepID=A0A3D8S659_9EURO|nr:hypothetical protein DSM5745_05108 [Aspergillus mulundensis]RDW81551.1 hypothetical protein DSM5745_05108 [Aspergillus mulundensis]